MIENGEQIVHSYHRWALEKGSDISSMPANVQAIAAAAWGAA